MSASRDYRSVEEGGLLPTFHPILYQYVSKFTFHTPIESSIGAHHWVHQFDTIVLGRIMARSDHDANPLSAQLLGAKRCEQAYSINNSVEEVTAMDCPLELQHGDRGVQWRRG